MEIYLLTSLTMLGVLAGIAALLRSKSKLTWRSATSAGLNSGLLSLAVGSIGLHYYSIEQYWLVIGGSVLAGLGGNAAVELAVTTAVFAVRTKYGVRDDPRENVKRKEMEKLGE